MTREEAMQILSNMIHDDIAVYGHKDKPRNIALAMGIEALGEMSVEEYRQKLMELFHITNHDELITYVVMPKEEEFKSLEYILRQYKFEPRLHGEWLEGSIGFHYCSECHNYALTDDNEEEVLSNFCPNCGADMRDKKDDLVEIIEAVKSMKEGDEE